MARKSYHVVPSGAQWDVKLSGVVQATKDTKEMAVEWAIATAKQNKPSQVVVHKKDGTIETEYTYGDDPFPPPG